MDEETRKIMEAGFGTLADLIRETNTELAATRAELGARLDQAAHRLGGQIAETNGRLDNLIVMAGDQTRGLREHVADLEARVEALEQKAS